MPVLSWCLRVPTAQWQAQAAQLRRRRAPAVIQVLRLPTESEIFDVSTGPNLCFLSANEEPNEEPNFVWSIDVLKDLFFFNTIWHTFRHFKF